MYLDFPLFDYFIHLLPLTESFTGSSIQCLTIIRSLSNFKFV